jgi:RecB family endonuclease NucS
VVSVFGRCRVDYDGRASSTLGPGDRLLLLKPDGTALVHTDEGHQPVNWQPPGCEHAVELAHENGDARLRVHSTRTTPAEALEVRFSAVAQVSRYVVADGAELALEGTEADLKRRVLDAPELVERGFEPRATERDTPAGAVDVYGVDVDGNTVVVELKRRRVGPDAVGQLSRYVESLRRDGHAGRRVRGVLVAPSVTDRARELLAEEGLEFVALEPTAE